MLYIRERRVWIWIEGDGAAGSRLTAALSSNRRTMDTDVEFEQLKRALLPAEATP
jgi:cytochrome c biogenesis protein